MFSTNTKLLSYNLSSHGQYKVFTQVKITLVMTAGRVGYTHIYIPPSLMTADLCRDNKLIARCVWAPQIWFFILEFLECFSKSAIVKENRKKKENFNQDEELMRIRFQFLIIIIYILYIYLLKFIMIITEYILIYHFLIESLFDRSTL